MQADGGSRLSESEVLGQMTYVLSQLAIANNAAELC